MRTATCDPQNDDLWGGYEPLHDARENDLSLVARFSYSWVEGYIRLAAEEKLDLASLPAPSPSSWILGREMSVEVNRQLSLRRSWDACIGQRVVMTNRIRNSQLRHHIAARGVALSSTASLVGVLRYVGYLQRSQTPLKLVAGVEWEVLCDNYLAPSDTSLFSSGVVDGERLFVTDYPDAVTCEAIEDVTLIPSLGSSSCVPPTPITPSALLAMYNVHKFLFLRQVPFKLMGDCAQLASPVILEHFITFLRDDDPDWQIGVVLIVIIFTTNFLQSMAFQKFNHLSIQSGLVVRSSLLGYVFEKCCTISQKALTHPELSTGRIVNMVSTDVERAHDFCWYAMYLWGAPNMLLIVVVLLFRLVGWCAVLGVLAMSFAMPIQAWVVKRQQNFRTQLSRVTDERVKMTAEFLSCIRLLKCMTGERSFIDRIQAVRCRELLLLKRIQLLRVITAFMSVATPSIVVATVLVAFYLSGHDLTPEVVFPTIALLNLMKNPFMTIPTVFTAFVQFLVSMKRITKFMEAEDESIARNSDIEGWYLGKDSKIGQESFVESPCQYAIVLENVTVSTYVPIRLPLVLGGTNSAEEEHIQNLCSWIRSRCCCVVCGNKKRRSAQDKTDVECEPLVSASSQSVDEEPHYELRPKHLLKGVSLTIPKHKLTIIAGPTGCGKSTLLQTMLGQFDVVAGSVYVEKTSFACVPQEPWMMNASIRENITFFADLEEDWFQQTLAICQLQTDLSSLVDGVETEIGERGVNLSGGQRARISLARAVYARRDVLLLDDPLCALDPRVSDRILKECICGPVLAKTTRVLCTHQMHVLPNADFLIMLTADGAVSFVGPYQEYLSKELLVDERQPAAHSVDRCIADDHSPMNDDSVFTSSPAPAKCQGLGLNDCNGKLMSPEEKAVGSVPWKSYMQYLEGCGGMPVAVIVALIFVVTEVVSISSSLWLSMWLVQSFQLSQAEYLYVYLGCVAMNIVCSPLRFHVTYAAMRLASLNLHRAALFSIGSAPMQFFDTTPLGRILNRFSRDMDVCDNDLQMSVITMLQTCFSGLSTLCVMLFSQPFALAALIPCLVIYYRILTLYNSANREIRRVSSIAKSPLNALLTETLTGRNTLRAYGKCNAVIKSATQKLDVVYSAGNLQNLTNRWLGVRLELMANTIITAIASFSIAGKLCRFGPTNVGLLSLGFTMAMSITQVLNAIVRQITAVESDMNSVERLLFYTDCIDHEDLPELTNEINSSHHHNISRAPKTQLTEAELTNNVSSVMISYRDVSMRFREGLPLVLNGLTFAIRKNDKVGVVGRTGSGKSSLLLSLMRMVDICAGEIEILGSSIQRFDLRTLRRLFCIIPQEPLLFDGTIRSNLDPLKEFCDEDVYLAVQSVGLTMRVEQEHLKIDSVISERGANFSVGERQLLCLARALLRRKDCKCILMDEATSSIDFCLDKAIQSTLNIAFADHTVVTVAHRLHTVLEYPTVMVMERGKVVEVGCPWDLVAEPQSILRAMIASHGLEEERKLLEQIHRCKCRHQERV